MSDKAEPIKATIETLRKGEIPEKITPREVALKFIENRLSNASHVESAKKAAVDKLLDKINSDPTIRVDQLLRAIETLDNLTNKDMDRFAGVNRRYPNESGVSMQIIEILSGGKDESAPTNNDTQLQYPPEIMKMIANIVNGINVVKEMTKNEHN